MEPSAPNTYYTYDQAKEMFPLSPDRKNEVKQESENKLNFEAKLKLKIFGFKFLFVVSILVALGGAILALSGHHLLLPHLNSLSQPWNYMASYGALGIGVLMAISAIKQIQKKKAMLKSSQNGPYRVYDPYSVEKRCLIEEIQTRISDDKKFYFYDVQNTSLFYEVHKKSFICRWDID